MPPAEETQALLERVAPWIERAQRFSGWDFTGLGRRNAEPGPPWDYTALARERAAAARTVLDLDTGGGERLAAILDGLATTFVATERWAPNVSLATQRLRPLAVEVVRADACRPPFASASFDLVLCRHGAIDAKEVVRLLRPGGTLLTQQIGGNHWRELDAHFRRADDVVRDHRVEYAEALRAEGLEVTTSAHDHRVIYPSLGEFVFMLLVTPWTIPGFDPATHVAPLVAFEAENLTADGLVVTESHFLLVAEKPA